jgi:hypothetical protein
MYVVGVVVWGLSTTPAITAVAIHAVPAAASIKAMMIGAVEVLFGSDVVGGRRD